MNIVIILLSVMLNAAAQIFLKLGMERIGRISLEHIPHVLPLAYKAATNPFIIAGFACYAVSLVTWMVVLSRVAVSYAYPMLSVGYIVTAVAGYYLFSEPLTVTRVLGIIVIILGVILINQ
ncbi:4-amino-4-deoxy-L-arabinose transferase [Piscirickettsia salmonis]|uniref:4-amino-4-deoxy-L-arabinose transferase n=2 Tax=Piscirickettsia salmonis TaxID=1238 RepID=A0A095DXF6_PISSA|nr:small Multidrug Resistance family protein [Piscirickettsia salmonis]AKP72810.1 4-amino-4-deoxy-L-arabinose transferase [Piscirickettsia salmonis LF-89 = ATCC VR-1361]ALA25728.1 4-amino-4-deoxy-L-arabinose transferase [Piscirickettsia salmonis]ALB23674.1 4-amino-4-deoxy-L-arabinose transferase [Piscirickettsia salmonis]ALY03534.1 4-amino-4-deoxy-L-arabinose transferase [Piscirickettsia salmonis]AMA43100.1 4-amino-4-deoxy-L-arabinose transferase [Piscirickettsia salmonis]